MSDLICTRCRHEKSITDFQKDGKLTDTCNDCLTKIHNYYVVNKTQYQESRKSWYERNKEKVLEYKRAYNKKRYANDPEYRAKAKARSKAARDRTKEHRKSQES